MHEFKYDKCWSEMQSEARNEWRRGRAVIGHVGVNGPRAPCTAGGEGGGAGGDVSSAPNIDCRIAFDWYM